MAVNAGGALSGAASGASAGAVFGPWGAAIGGVIGGVMGLFSGGQEEAQARIQAAQQQAQYTISTAQAQAQNLLNQSNASISNALASAGNNLTGAQEQTNLYVQSLNNQRVWKGTADVYNQLQENIGRYSDDYARGSFEQRIQAAENIGRASAELSGAGVGGNTAQLINRTMRLQAGIAEEEARIGNRSTMWQFAKQRQGLSDQLSNAGNYLLQRDTSGYNYATTVAQNVVGPANLAGGSTFNSTQSQINGILGAVSNINWKNLANLSQNGFKYS